MTEKYLGRTSERELIFYKFTESRSPQNEAWTTTHVFFVIMGGFYYYQNGKPPPPTL